MPSFMDTSKHRVGTGIVLFVEVQRTKIVGDLTDIDVTKNRERGRCAHPSQTFHQRVDLCARPIARDEAVFGVDHTETRIDRQTNVGLPFHERFQSDDTLSNFRTRHLDDVLIGFTHVLQRIDVASPSAT